MLQGEMKVLTDRESKAKFRKKGYERYDPAGIDEPNCCIPRFTAKEGNDYRRQRNETFPIG